MANNDIVRNFGDVSRAKPSAVQDQATGPMRVGRRGEQYVAALAGSKMIALADEGSYFVATNATAGTGVAGIPAADGYDALESLLSLRNSSTDSESVRIYLDFIRIQPTAAGTNGTNFNLAVDIDNTTRYSSGGSAITPVNTNMDSTEATKAVCHFGALVTTAASSSERRIFSGLMRSVIKVIGDVYTLKFGDSSSSPTAHIVAGTAIANIQVNLPPVVLGPGDVLLLHEYAASQTVAASYEFQIGWWER